MLSGNTFVNAPVFVSAYDSMTLTNNTVEGGRASVVSYTNAANAKVVATDNALDANYSDYNARGTRSRAFSAANSTAQDDFIVFVK